MLGVPGAAGVTAGRTSSPPVSRSPGREAPEPSTGEDKGGARSSGCPGPLPPPPPGKMEAGRAEAGGRPRREQGRAGGSLTGLGRARELPLRVVSVPVLGRRRRRRLGLLAGSLRRGSDAPALRCPPPAAAPGDGLPRRRRLRGRTVAQGFLLWLPRYCARSSCGCGCEVRHCLRLRGCLSLRAATEAPDTLRPRGSWRPAPSSGLSPALTCVLRSRRRRDVGRHRNALWVLGRPPAARRTQDA